MSSWIKRSFGYGLGAFVARSLFGVLDENPSDAPREPIREMTEEEILADEKRFDEEAKRYAAEDRGAGAKR